MRAAEDLSATLQRGLFEEEANNNLPAAIKAYEAVINATDAQRKLAGTALFRLAECQRKLGRTNDAVTLYQRVLREYPDQTRLADLSRQYVVTKAPAELGRDLGTERIRFLERQLASQEADYARIATLYRSLTNLTRAELKRIVPTAAPDPLLTTLHEQRSKAEQRLVELLQGRSPSHPDALSAKATLDTIDKQIDERLDGIVASIALKAATEKASLDQAKKSLEEARADAGAGTGAPTLSKSARAEQKRLLEEEIKIVEKELAKEREAQEVLFKKGIESSTITPSISAKQREVLALRRQVAALDVVLAEAAAGSAASAPTDEEDKEVRRIQALIKDSPDLINAGDTTGWIGSTPLHKAATKGQLVVARFLLANKANVNARRQNEVTPLHEAVMNGHKSMAELLLANGADVTIADSFGTPLHHAATRGYRAIAEALLANKANPDAVNHDNSTPLHAAVRKGFQNVAEALLEAGADVNKVESFAGMTGDPHQYSHQVGTPLHIAVHNGSKPLTELILARRPDVNLRNQFGETPLHLVWNNVELATRLVAAKADVNARVGKPGNDTGKTPLCLAVINGYADMVEFLLKNGADPNVGFRTLRTSSGSYSTDDYTPLIAAVHEVEPNERIIKALLDHKADSNARNSGGYPPLHLSLFRTNRIAVELLLKHGADIESRDRDGNTPLCHMVGGKGIIQLLLDHKANPNAQDNEGNAPLSLMRGSKEIIQLLLDHKANPNVQNNDGNTPLHELASRTLGFSLVSGRSSWSNPSSQKDLAELLIARGADVNVRNRGGSTPLNSYGVPANPSNPYAKELAELLLNHGAKDEQRDLAADPESIRVWRKGMSHGRVVFARDAAGHNRFTLMEALLNLYSLRQTPPTVAQRAEPPGRALKTTAPGQPGLARPVALVGGSGSLPTQPSVVGYAEGPVATYEPLNEFAFPDLARIRILRLEDPVKERKVISVNLINAAGIVLCASDVLLEFGDIIEIPEREYRLDESRAGFTSDQNKQLSECVLKKVEIVVKGEAKGVKLYPQAGMAYLANTMKLPHVRSMLRSTSDLFRLRITRRADPATGQLAKELTVNLEAFQRSGKPQWDDLWLRDGDIIEVPERE